MPNRELPKDNRLTNTTSEYRIWGDNSSIMVPRGQSTTKPLSSEVVPANVNVYGEVKAGYFNRPIVDFTNCEVALKRFDRFNLQIWRDGDDLGNVDDDKDWFQDLGIEAVLLSFDFGVKNILDDGYEPYGEAKQSLFLTHVEGDWISPVFRFGFTDTVRLEGNAQIICSDDTIPGDNVLDTGLNLREGQLHIYVVFDSVLMTVGNTTMDLNEKNLDFFNTIVLDHFTFTLEGGQTNG